MSINIKHFVAIPYNEGGGPLWKINGLFPEPLMPKPKAIDD
jgi:hypothetical protein